jgi:pimeloyl-ACP methyl ester carboxylesterase
MKLAPSVGAHHPSQQRTLSWSTLYNLETPISSAQRRTHAVLCALWQKSCHRSGYRHATRATRHTIKSSLVERVGRKRGSPHHQRRQTWLRPFHIHSRKNCTRHVPSDLEELLNGLDIRQFSVHGISGGGPYALACAYHFPRTRLLGTGVMCSAAPLSAGLSGMSMRKRIRIYMGVYTPWILAWWDQMTWALWEEYTALAIRLGQVKEDDPKHIIELEEIRQGPLGYTYDQNTYRRHWGFELGEVDSTGYICTTERRTRTHPTIGVYGFATGCYQTLWTGMHTQVRITSRCKTIAPGT